MAEKKYVYPFDEAYGLGKEILGGKGAGLAEMSHIGVPVPEGFTITTEACTLYYDSGKQIPDYVVDQIFEAIKGIEAKTGKTFGGKKNPLLVSVRSGARVSMPGMMDTILNLGLNETTCAALAKETNTNLRLAYEAIERGGNAPCALNAANEVAVAAYLKGRIGFYDISRINQKCLAGLNFVADPSLEDIFETNAEVAKIADGCIN